MAASIFWCGRKRVERHWTGTILSESCSNGCRSEVVLVSSRDGSDYGPLVLDCGARGFIPKGELSGARLAALLA